MQEPVIVALRQAVEAEPGNVAIRLILVEKLLGADAGREALTHCQVVLTTEPDSVKALNYAALAAEQAGDPRLAARYKSLADSISMARSEQLLDDFQDEAEQEPEELEELPEPENPFGIERPTVTLRDVIGMTAVKRTIDMSFLAPLRRPDLSKAFGVEAKGGLLLFGPPGCGKTFIARALAGELEARFLPVRIDMILGPYLGESERNVHALIDLARKAKPCVVFFDELDALGHKRSNLSGMTRTLSNQILSEMDGAQFDNDGLYFLGATNHPWDVDAAFRRPGRFDRSLLVLPPDRIARRAILQQAIEGKPVQGLNLDLLADQTDGYSGADLNQLVRVAAGVAFQNSMGGSTAGSIGPGDFRDALKEVRPTTRAWLESARNFAVYANQDGSMDELVAYLKQQKIL